MLDSPQFQRALRALPVLRDADARMQREFMQNAYLARIPAGRDIFAEGDRTDAIALLLDGVVRVYKIGETGREITLYRFGSGESCVLTANAILSQKTFPALATVEEEAEAIMIPAGIFRQWVDRSDLWRSFVFDLLSQRLTNMLAVVDDVAFRRMDARLAALLLEQSRHENPIRTTHQAIAADLGSSREVISRILADFAALEMVSLARGFVEILDRPALRDRAAV